MSGTDRRLIEERSSNIPILSEPWRTHSAEASQLLRCVLTASWSMSNMHYSIKICKLGQIIALLHHSACDADFALQCAVSLQHARQLQTCSSQSTRSSSMRWSDRGGPSATQSAQWFLLHVPQDSVLAVQKGSDPKNMGHFPRRRLC